VVGRARDWQSCRPALLLRANPTAVLYPAEKALGEETVHCDPTAHAWRLVGWAESRRRRKRKGKWGRLAEWHLWVTVAAAAVALVLMVSLAGHAINCLVLTVSVLEEGLVKEIRSTVCCGINRREASLAMEDLDSTTAQHSKHSTKSSHVYVISHYTIRKA